MSKRPKIGVALGSGGARGWCHIGVLKGLENLGVKPDAVAGTSMGALVGAAWAGDRLSALEEWVRALTPTRFVTLMDVRLRSGGLVEARGIETMLEEIGLAPKIEDLAHPFTAIATDMATGREIWLDEGPSHRAVRASAGIPGVMSPVELGGHWLLDGGLVNRRDHRGEPECQAAWKDLAGAGAEAGPGLARHDAAASAARPARDRPDSERQTREPELFRRAHRRHRRDDRHDPPHALRR
jgi:hypothetical protein